MASNINKKNKVKIKKNEIESNKMLKTKSKRLKRNKNKDKKIERLIDQKNNNENKEKNEDGKKLSIENMNKYDSNSDNVSIDLNSEETGSYENSGSDNEMFNNFSIRKMVSDDIENLFLFTNIKYIPNLEELMEKNLDDFIVNSNESYLFGFLGAIDYKKNFNFFHKKLNKLINEKIISKYKNLEVVIYNRIINVFNPEIFRYDFKNKHYIFISQIRTGLLNVDEYIILFPEYNQSIIKEPPYLIENIHLNSQYLLKKRIGIFDNYYDIFILNLEMVKNFISLIKKDTI